MMWYFGVWSTLSLTRTQPLQTKRCILAAPREAVVWIKWISLLAVTLHFQESRWMYSTFPPSSTAVRLLIIYLDPKRVMFLIISEAVTMFLDCLFSIRQTHSHKFETLPPKKKTHFSHHVAATRRELVRRRWCKGGWTEKDRRWKKRDKMNGDRNIRWQSDKEDEGTFGPDHPFAVTPDSFRMRAQDLREFQNCICEQRLLILPPSLGISF